VKQQQWKRFFILFTCKENKNFCLSCHLAFLEAKSSKFDLFWYGLPGKNDLNIWPFLNIKNSKFQSLCSEKSDQNLQYFQLFYEILTFNLVILTNLQRKLGLFSFLRIWPFLKVLMANFGLFNFLNLATLICVSPFYKYSSHISTLEKNTVGPRYSLAKHRLFWLAVRGKKCW